MRRIGLWLGWVSGSLTVLAFFLPWAHIDVREPGAMKQLRSAIQEQDLVDGLMKKVGRVTVEVRRGTETITGDLPSLKDMPRQVSGVQIPQMANQKNAKVAMALVEMLTNKRQDTGMKSYAVYLVPGLTLLGALLLTILAGSAIVSIGVALLSLAIAGIGFWKLLTTNTRTLFIAITIGPGLWLSLWSYVGLALAALLQLTPRQPDDPKCQNTSIVPPRTRQEQ